MLQNKIHSPTEKAEHHYNLKIYRPGVWLLFFDQIQVFLCTDQSLAREASIALAA
jgi:hypothetical protein